MQWLQLRSCADKRLSIRRRAAHKRLAMRVSRQTVVRGVAWTATAGIAVGRARHLHHHPHPHPHPHLRRLRRRAQQPTNARMVSTTIVMAPLIIRPMSVAPVLSIPPRPLKYRQLLRPLHRRRQQRVTLQRCQRDLRRRSRRVEDLACNCNGKVRRRMLRNSKSGAV